MASSELLTLKVAAEAMPVGKLQKMQHSRENRLPKTDPLDLGTLQKEKAPGARFRLYNVQKAIYM